jgi:hypothetical protein
MPDIVYLNSHTVKIKPHESWKCGLSGQYPMSPACYRHITRMSTHDFSVVFRAHYGHRRPQKYGAHN